MRIPVLLLAGFVFVFGLPILLLGFVISGLIDHYRRYCPVHHARFSYEYVHLSSQEANRNRQRRLEREENMRQAAEQGWRVNWKPLNGVYHSPEKEKLFPYSCTEPLMEEEEGIYPRRYCAYCRSAEAECNGMPRQKNNADADGRRKLREDVQQILQERHSEGETPCNT